MLLDIWSRATVTNGSVREPPLAVQKTTADLIYNLTIALSLFCVLAPRLH